MNVMNEPVLSEDFADRVLKRADIVIAQRRRFYRAATEAAALFLVSMGVVSWIAISGASKAPEMRPGTQSVALLGNFTEAQTEETDALSDFFPDAGSVSRFAAEYSDATDESDTDLLSDEDPSS
ncbi:MAG TPA: hypothetical protein VMF67_00845 [Rhizomicrobium sp.]|nr:hypothetical protein [Rhizomicrobium sp.]